MGRLDENLVVSGKDQRRLRTGAIEASGRRALSGDGATNHSPDAKGSGRLDGIAGNWSPD